MGENRIGKLRRSDQDRLWCDTSGGCAGYVASERRQAEGLELDHETLLRWLLEEGPWQRQRRRGRQRRERFGALVQMDGNHHPGGVADDMVDDHTGRRFGLLLEQETTAMRTLWGRISRYGVPQAF
ncbi:MAG: hypothetical protein AB1898_26505 [Acidobacteriota bacterium]